MRRATYYAEKIKKAGKMFPIVYKIAAQSYYNRNYPRHLFIETTAECNLTCSYCPRENVSNQMEFPLFKKIIREATKYGPCSFSLHLFGEPTLWRHITQGIEFIKKQNKCHTVILTTNGTRLNTLAEDLIKAGTDEIIWSWRPEAKFRGSTLKVLREATEKNICKFRVRIIKEVTPKEEIEKWENWPEVEYRNLHNYGGNMDFKTVKPETRWPCYHLWYAPAIAWNGNFLLCCADPHQKEIVGNVEHETVSDLWRKLEPVRQSHLKGEYSGICANCDVWKNYPNTFFSWQRRT